MIKGILPHLYNIYKMELISYNRGHAMWVVKLLKEDWLTKQLFRFITKALEYKAGLN